MSQKTHSQDSNSDPRNEEDYDTWEYGTEPIPYDESWNGQGDWNDHVIGIQIQQSKREKKKDDYIQE